MRRTLIWLALAAIALTACSGDGATTETFFEIGSGLSDGGGDVEDASEDAQRTTSNQPIETNVVAANRKVIRTAALRLTADDTRSAYEEIVTVAERLGGYVAGADVSPSGEGDQPLIQVTVRVPTASLTEALAAFKDSAAEVVSESQDAEDVTDSFIDLEAQLANLTLLETELRALLEEVRRQPDADPDKLLRVFTEISNTRVEIERIQGQLDYLGDAVDLATVNMTIEPTASAVPIVEEGWAPTETVRDASRDLISGLQGLADVVITFAIAVLPMLLLVFGLPGLVLLMLYRVWRARRTVRSTAEPIPSE
jgi:hypothetical protein